MIGKMYSDGYKKEKRGRINVEGIMVGKSREEEEILNRAKA